MTQIDETKLPGIGLRREFGTRGGDRVGVITTRSGRRDLLLYDREDVDVCSAVVPLDVEESDTLADLLGADRITDAASTLQNLPDLAIDWVPVDESSAIAGTTIGEHQLRTRTGAFVAAIIHGHSSVPAPGPDQVLPAGAMVVAVGTPDAVSRLAELLGPA